MTMDDDTQMNGSMDGEGGAPGASSNAAGASGATDATGTHSPATASGADAQDSPRAAGVDQVIVQAFEAELADALRKADEAQHKADEVWNRYLRAEADLDNLRKAAERQRQDAVMRVRRDLLNRVLDVADNLDRALAFAEADPQSLLAGIQATARDLDRFLDREGVQRIAAQDAPFDPNLHEAVGLLIVPGVTDEQVISVEQAGYTLNGDLLRPARVIVGRPAEGGGGG